jgi:glycosyltransferase involved in cell wall biosynthesis
MKTANLTGSISRNAGGLFESVRRLVQSLADKGMEVQVFGTEDEHTAADIGAWSPVPAKAFRPIGPHQFGYSPDFRRALEAFDPDLTHTHGLWVYSSIATSLYCRKKASPYVISAHGMLDPWAMRHSRWKKAIAHYFFEGAHLRNAGCFRALCEAEARSIRQLGLKNPIAIIPNGIDLPKTANVETLNSETSRAPWAGRIELGQKVLLFLSRIHPKKGLVNLLKAWAEVCKAESGKRKAKEWILAIAGWDQGGHEDELKRLCDEIGIAWQDAREHSTFNIQHPTPNGKAASGRQKADLRSSEFQGVSVLFLGPRFGDDKTACYRNCDAFILPSFSEGVPMVVLEAWAHGVPVLMTPECNLPFGFTRDAAIRVETNVQSIVQGLETLFQASDAQRQALGDNGLRLVREQFAWPMLGREMAGLYQWMLGGGNMPACIADF